MTTITIDAAAIARQSRNPESGPWMLRRFVWNQMRFDILRLRGSRLEQIYESWLEVAATDHRPDDCIHHVCQMIHIMCNMSDALEVPETKGERRERAKWNRKRRKGQ